MLFEYKESDKIAISKAIEEAEKQTSGEIRVHVDNKCSADPVKEAISHFNRLEMFKTKDRNGILIYVAKEDRKLAIIGDKNINEKVPENYWENTKNQLIDSFKKEDYVNGLVQAIFDVGEKLKNYFPYNEDDRNELLNDLSQGEGK
jgi:uncharacterized membrane protein